MTAARRRTLAALLAALTAVPLVYATSGCNVVRLQQGRLESRLAEAGLLAHVEPMGEATVRYWDGGKGPPLLLVHGFGAEAVWQWTDQVEAFSGAYRVIVPDLLWFGGSSSTERDFSLEHQVRMLVALLDKLGEQQVDVVGISYGGFAAYELAHLHPERVRKLVIVDSPGCAYQRADYDALLQRFGVARSADLFIPSDEVGVGKLMDLAYFDPPWTPEFARRQVLTELYAQFREEKKQLLEVLVQSMDTRPDCSVAPRIPALVVWGREDGVFPLAIGERLAKGLGSTARLEVIDRARHAPNLEHPARFNELIRAFLDAKP
ncbi:MAG: alpha/beta hydrolase [Myxococcales bacterium]